MARISLLVTIIGLLILAVVLLHRSRFLGPLITYNTATRCGWFRLFDRIGLAWIDHRRYGPLFSERYAGKHGIPKARRQLHIGPWHIAISTKKNP